MLLLNKDLSALPSNFLLPEKRIGFAGNLLEELTIKHKEFTLYKAGLPSYPRNFTRDVIIASLIMGSPKMLEDQLIFSAHLQGTKKDPRTGEQPGAIFHEYDIKLDGGVELSQRPGRTTFYAASDTTALFLIGHEWYQRMTGDKKLYQKQKANILRATEYILSHLYGGSVFIEDPRFCEAEAYALKVTYWKDSQLWGRPGGEPKYPVIYPLAHIQNIAGIRSASYLLNSKELGKVADQMTRALNLMYDEKTKNFPIAIDSQGAINGINSDGLHSLFYLEPGSLTGNKLEKLVKSSMPLETSMGYRTLIPEIAAEAKDKYHAETVWTHEQAQIHIGAIKHLNWAIQNGKEELSASLSHVADVSGRIYSYFKNIQGSYPELFIINSEGNMLPGGCDPQLWAYAAKVYFDNFANSQTTPSKLTF